MPANDGAWLHEKSHISPAAESARQEHEQPPLVRPEAWPLDLAASHEELLAQHQVLSDESLARSTSVLDEAGNNWPWTQSLGQRLLRPGHDSADSSTRSGLENEEEHGSDLTDLCYNRKVLCFVISSIILRRTTTVATTADSATRQPETWPRTRARHRTVALLRRMEWLDTTPKSPDQVKIAVDTDTL